MPSFTEGKYPGEFLASEANGEQSRDVATLINGQNLIAGTVLGVITASGKATQVAPAAGDGSQTAKQILYGNVDATGGDTLCAVISRNAEVNAAEITYPAGATNNQIAAINAQLAAVGIIVRPGSV